MKQTKVLDFGGGHSIKAIFEKGKLERVLVLNGESGIDIDAKELSDWLLNEVLYGCKQGGLKVLAEQATPIKLPGSDNQPLLPLEDRRVGDQAGPTVIPGVEIDDRSSMLKKPNTVKFTLPNKK